MVMNFAFKVVADGQMLSQRRDRTRQKREKQAVKLQEAA